MKRAGFILTFCFLYCFSSQAQVLKPMPVIRSRNILTEQERIQYQLFRDYDRLAFTKAVFFQHSPKKVLCLISYDEYRVDSVFISNDSLQRIRYAIQNVDALMRLKMAAVLGKRRLVLLRNGDHFYATISHYDNSQVKLVKAGNEQLTVEPRAIRKLRDTKVTRDKETLLTHRSDPNYTKMVFTNNSLMLKKKELLVSDQYFLIKGANYGITKNLNANLGVSHLPTDKLSSQIAYGSVRTGMSIGQAFHVSAGVSALYLGAAITMGYISMSLGDQDISFTGGVGSAWFYEKGQAYPLPPVLMLGANARLSNHFALVTDNMVTYDRFGGLRLYSAALRFFGNRFSADAGIGNINMVTGGGRHEENLPLPVISFTWCISCGKQKDIKP